MTVTLSEKEVQKFKADCTAWSRERSFTHIQATFEAEKNQSFDVTRVNGTLCLKFAEDTLTEWEKTHPFPKLFPDA